MSLRGWFQRLIKGETRTILGNASWNALQQFTALASSSLIGILLVTAVPVAEFGLYSYALALCSIGVAVMTAGLSGLAVKALVHGEARNGQIVAGLLLVREGFALLGYILIGIVSLTSGNSLTIAATLISALALFGRALDAPELWFQSQMRTRRTASIRLTVTLALFVLRLGLILFFPHIWLFLALYVVEALAVGTWILLRYRRDNQSPGFARPDAREVGGMLRESLPLMLSAVANQVNLKGDVIVLQALIGGAAVGVYAAATRFSELAFFLPVVLMTATFPVMLRQRRELGSEHPEYKASLQRAYDRAFWSGVLVALLALVCGWILISLVFGAEYEESKLILAIQVIACPFVFMAAVYSKWIIAEGILWSSLLRHGLGAVVNIALNLFLVPRIGLEGAAIATVVSYITASYLACFIGKRSLPAGISMTLAIVAPVRYIARRIRPTH